MYVGCKINVSPHVAYNIIEKNKCMVVKKYIVPKFMSKEECRQRIEKKRSLCFQFHSILPYHIHTTISTNQTFLSLFFHINSTTFLSFDRDAFTFDADTNKHFLVVSMRKLPYGLSKYGTECV